MRVLIGCEHSGTVRDAFRRCGHDAWSCDLLPSDGPHLHCDVRDVIRDGWDLGIFHPPCTFLCNSGVRWLSERPERWQDMRDAAAFFRNLLDADIPKIGLENPIMHGHALRLIGRYPDQIIQPWQFGHPECKATCLWLKGLPALRPTNIVDGREQRIAKMPPSEDRSMLRSLTYHGIAAAMADQWGCEAKTLVLRRS